MQYMHYYAPPANELLQVAPENITDAIPSENGSAGIVLNEANKHMSVDENGGATDTEIGNKMEEDGVDAKDDMMQEGNKMGEGNGEAHMATEETEGEAQAGANATSKDRMEEEANSTSKDNMEEANPTSKDKMDEE